MFEFAKIYFSLNIAPSTYKRLINIVLCEFVDRICIEYLDDVIVFLKRALDHIAELRTVFERSRAGG